MLWFISIIMDGIRCVFLLVDSRIDCLASDFNSLEEGRCHVEKAVWITMGHLGGRRTLQAYTTGVLEAEF